MFYPYGWQNTPSGWQPIEHEQRVIRRALALHDQEHSLRAIAKILNREGYGSREGGKIWPTQVLRWIRRVRAG